MRRTTSWRPRAGCGCRSRRGAGSPAQAWSRLSTPDPACCPGRSSSTVGSKTRGYDVGKKINGRKRHIAVDTLGLPVMITVTPASMNDRDAARELLWRLRLTQPQITQVWADSAYAGQLANWADDRLWTTLRTVTRPCGATGFVVLPRRWKVERTIGWVMNARRNVRGYERLPQHSEAHLNWALITVMTRRLTRRGRTSHWARKPPAVR